MKEIESPEKQSRVKDVKREERGGRGFTLFGFPFLAKKKKAFLWEAFGVSFIQLYICLISDEFSCHPCFGGLK